ncbi:hypothetical protein GCL60_10935 [Silvanigrella paludirubra]|uniref:Uncharacterized protein n=1 Tax=Silvanigrella paludirubra TaxID=2499159 RepID=A0A6N6VU30_9BACT|nr:hypothetical protein [Silvanigrella paludirubra]KAB8037681.1 hypothetical protein GCL60_10935 [Silvanigrella paludirubra]
MLNYIHDVKKYLKIYNQSPKFNFGLFILIYMIVYIILTDCLIWYSSNHLAGISWKKLIVYSIFSYPIWMQIGIKGLSVEQGDLITSGRWFVINTLPINTTVFILFNSLGITFKSFSLKICLCIYFITIYYFSKNIIISFLGLSCFFIGCVNINLIQILGKYLSPKAYIFIFSSILYSLLSFLSGAFFPLGFFFDINNLSLFNPTYIAVSLPVENLVNLIFQDNIQDKLLNNFIVNIIYSLCWSLILFIFAIIIEGKRRESFYR